MIREPFTARRVLVLILIGACGGLLSGALGVGGGTIMVPLMIWLLGFDQRRAAATSLAAIVPTAIAGSVGYLLNGELDLAAAILIAAGGIVGSLIGTRLLRTLPLGWLRWMFIALLVLVAVRMFFVLPSRGADLELSPGVLAGLIGLGLAIGIAAGLFGIGGGVIIVPVLVTVFGVSDLIAKGTSLLAMIPTAATGTVSNARAGMVRVSEGLIMGGAAVLASIGGVALAFLLPPRVSAIVFGVFMLLIAIQLTVRAIRARRS